MALPNGTNALPVALADKYDAVAGHTLHVLAADGVLSNDTDANGDPLTASKVYNASHGTVVLNADGSFDYTAYGDYVGDDKFIYMANDGHGNSHEVAVDIVVSAQHGSPPVAVADSYNVPGDALLSQPGHGVLANDSDPEGSPLTAHLVWNAAHGNVTINEDGSFYYAKWDTSYNGEDAFYYTANDGGSSSEITKVTMNLVPPGGSSPPVTTADSYSVEKGGTLVVLAANGVLSNDSDPEGDVMLAGRVFNASHGEVSLNGDGSFTYQSWDTSFMGDDTFVYEAHTDANTSVQTLVTIHVGDFVV